VSRQQTGKVTTPEVAEKLTDASSDVEERRFSAPREGSKTSPGFSPRGRISYPLEVFRQPLQSCRKPPRKKKDPASAAGVADSLGRTVYSPHVRRYDSKTFVAKYKKPK